MSVLSDLDLLYRDGAVTENDFIERGIPSERAKAFAEMIADHEAEQAKCPSFVRRMFGESRLTRDIEHFIDGDGFYTVHDTERL